MKEWNYDFHLFKDKCKEERPTIEVMTEEGNASLEKKMSKKQRREQEERRDCFKEED